MGARNDQTLPTFNNQGLTQGLATDTAIAIAVQATRTSSNASPARLLLSRALWTRFYIHQLGKSPVKQLSGGTTVVKGDDTDALVTSMPNYIIECIAGTGFMAATFTMIMLTYTTVVSIDYISLLLCFTLVVLTPLIGYQRYQIRQLGTLRQAQNMLRQSVNKFTEENIQMSNSVTELSSHITNFKSTKAELQSITNQYGDHADQLLTYIKDNASIQVKIERALKTQIMHQVFDAILAVDSDKSFTVTHHEVLALETRLSAIPGVVFYPDRFEQFLKKSGNNDLTLADVCRLARNLQKLDQIPPDERVLEFEPKQVIAQSMQV